MEFEDSRKKIERAYKHIRDLDLLVRGYGESDFYSIAVEYDQRQRTNNLNFSIHVSSFKVDAALIVGDILHNLRSALDALYHRLVPEGLATSKTRFPILETAEELDRILKSALKQQQIDVLVANHIRSRVQPYKHGNPLLWTLHDLNIVDKHQLLIPALQMIVFDGIRLQDEKDGSIVPVKPVFMDESGSVRLRELDNRKVALMDKGHSAATIIFDLKGGIFAGQAIIQTLTRVAEEVTRTLDSFELLLDGTLPGPAETRE